MNSVRNLVQMGQKDVRWNTSTQSIVKDSVIENKHDVPIDWFRPFFSNCFQLGSTVGNVDLVS